jgi:hypothetical protein
MHVGLGLVSELRGMPYALDEPAAVVAAPAADGECVSECSGSQQSHAAALAKVPNNTLTHPCHTNQSHSGGH